MRMSDMTSGSQGRSSPVITFIARSGASTPSRPVPIKARALPTQVPRNNAFFTRASYGEPEHTRHGLRPPAKVNMFIFVTAKGERTQKRIVAGAVKLFVRRGYEATTLRDIAHAA